MRVADAVRVTSVVQRLRVGDKFTEADGDWEVTRETEDINHHAVKVWVKPYPSVDGQRSRSYAYDRGHRVTLIRK